MGGIAALKKRSWDRRQLLEGTDRPAAARRKAIPKPDGGQRLLGIPNVVDQLIQQAILNVLTPIFDPDFSESSFGFRPQRSVHGAISRPNAPFATPLSRFVSWLQAAGCRRDSGPEHHRIRTWLKSWVSGVSDTSKCYWQVFVDAGQQRTTEYRYRMT